MRALEEAPTHSTARTMPLISQLGSVHIPVEDPYEGITYEQIIEISISYGIFLGNSGTNIADLHGKMVQDRVVAHSADVAS